MIANESLQAHFTIFDVRDGLVRAPSSRNMPVAASSRKLRMLDAVARQHHYNADVLP